MFMLRFFRRSAGSGGFPWVSITFLTIYVLYQILKLYVGTMAMKMLHNYSVEKVSLDEFFSELRNFNEERQDNSGEEDNSNGNMCPISDNPYESPMEQQSNLPLKDDNNPDAHQSGSVLFQRIQNYAEANGYSFLYCYKDPQGYNAKWYNMELSTALYFHFYLPDGESFGFETDSANQKRFVSDTSRTFASIPLPSCYMCQVFPEIMDPAELWEMHRAGMEYLEAEQGFSFPPNQTWQYERYMPGGAQGVLKAFQDHDIDKIWDADLLSLPETQQKLENHIRSIPFWRIRIMGWVNERPKKYNGHFISELIAMDLLRVKFNWGSLIGSLIYPAIFIYFITMYILRTYN